MPNIKELVEGKKKRPNEPPRGRPPVTVQTPGGYGIGAFVPGLPPPEMSPLERNIQDFFIPGELDKQQSKQYGAPNLMYKAATTERTAQALWQDKRVRDQYMDYLFRNGASGDEINEIIRDLYMQQKKAREEMYKKPVEITVEEGR